MNYKIIWVDTDTDTIRRQWILPLPIVVGRCPTADITIDDASISRRHCQFMLDPHGTLIVRDLGAKNGVYVDQRKVDKGSVRPGSDVRLGLVTLRAELTDEELDHIEQEQETNVYDLAETQRVKIIPPEDDRYELG